MVVYTLLCATDSGVSGGYMQNKVNKLALYILAAGILLAAWIAFETLAPSRVIIN
jgi:hypothetical protein